MTVVVERVEQGMVRGTSENYLSVVLDQDLVPGTVTACRIVEVRDMEAVGEDLPDGVRVRAG